MPLPVRMTTMRPSGRLSATKMSPFGAMRITRAPGRPRANGCTEKPGTVCDGARAGGLADRGRTVDGGSGGAGLRQVGRRDLAHHARRVGAPVAKGGGADVQLLRLRKRGGEQKRE